MLTGSSDINEPLVAEVEKRNGLKEGPSIHHRRKMKATGLPKLGVYLDELGKHRLYEIVGLLSGGPLSQGAAGGPHQMGAAGGSMSQGATGEEKLDLLPLSAAIRRALAIYHSYLKKGGPEVIKQEKVLSREGTYLPKKAGRTGQKWTPRSVRKKRGW